ncbi:hypothetical protein Dimus_017314 [Dionaea muscipula]
MVTLPKVNQKIIECIRSVPSLEERKQIVKRTNLDCAKEAALKLYNESKDGKGEELELVEAFNANPFLVRGAVFHMNFTARPKDCGYVEVKRYFAEIKCMKNHVLSKFCPVEPNGIPHQLCVAG